MTKREASSDDIERLKYIADMLVELDEMALSIGQAELGLLIGVAALAASEELQRRPLLNQKQPSHNFSA